MTPPPEPLESVFIHLRAFLYGDSHDAGSHWEALANLNDAGSLEGGLWRAVAAPSLDVDASLVLLFERLSGAEFSEAVDDRWSADDVRDSGDRIARIPALVSSALVARSARRVAESFRQGLGPPDEAVDGVIVWSQRTESILSDGDAPVDSATVSVRPSSTAEGVLQQLPDATRVWATYWLRSHVSEPGLPSASFDDVRVAAVSLSERRAAMRVWLQMSRLARRRSVPLEAPEMALRPIARELIEEIASATHGAGLSHGVCWRISFMDANVEIVRWSAFHGRSISLAAHTAARLVKERLQADPAIAMIGLVAGGQLLPAGGELRKAGVARSLIVSSQFDPAWVSALRQAGFEGCPFDSTQHAIARVAGAASVLRRYLEAVILRLESATVALGRVHETRGTKALDVDVPIHVNAAFPGAAGRHESRDPLVTDRPWLPESNLLDGRPGASALTDFAGSDSRCAVLLGPAGSGKTHALRMTTLHLARHALHRLTVEQCDVRDVPIPIEYDCEKWMRAVAGPSAGAASYWLAPVFEAVLNRTPIGSVSLGVALANLFDGRFERATSNEQAPVWFVLDGFDQIGAGRQEFCDMLTTLASWRVKVVLASRPEAYEECRDLLPPASSFWLTEFSRGQQHRLVDRWFDGAVDPRHRQLKQLLEESDTLRGLAGTPFLLSLLCRVIEGEPIRADIGRTELYRVAVKDLLLPRVDPHLFGQSFVARALRFLGIVAAAAFDRFLNDGFISGETLQDLGERTSQRVAIAAWHDSSERQKVHNLLKYAERAGVLVPWASDRHRFEFPHRSIGEFLVGVGLAADLETSDIERAGAESGIPFLDKVKADAWRGAVRFSIGMLGAAGDDASQRQAGRVVDALCSRPDGGAETIVLLGEAVGEGGAACVPADVRARLQVRLLGLMRDSGVVARVRTEAGDAIGLVGDPRFAGLATRPVLDEFGLPRYLPDSIVSGDHMPGALQGQGFDGMLAPEPYRGFVEIPAGTFSMGSNLPFRSDAAGEDDGG